LFIPALLSILDPKIEPKEEENAHQSAFARWYGKFIVNHDGKIILSSLLFFMILGAGISLVRIDSNTVRYFKEDVPFRISVDFLQKNLTGPMSYEIVVDSGAKDGIKDPAFLQMVQTFSHQYAKRYKDIRHISSLLDVVKKFHEVITGKNGLPQDQNLIAQYLLLYSLSLPQGMEINDKMDIDEQLLRISASVNIVDTSKDLEMIKWAEQWWANTPYSAKVNGQTAMFAYMQSDVTSTLINSISIAIVVVSAMMLFVFKNIRLLPLLILPNILPIILVLGVMGWLSIDIDLGVAVAGAIIIGVAVDDTIHFLVKYFEAKKLALGDSEAFAYVISYAGEAIIFTTIILSCAFLLFVGSQFYPNYHFGIVTASALVIAVVADLLMLPAIFSKLTKRKRF
jgi:predicted RND superfamily exporter protein